VSKPRKDKRRRERSKARKQAPIAPGAPITLPDGSSNV
jgi:hypothetical protein